MSISLVGQSKNDSVILEKTGFIVFFTQMFLMYLIIIIVKRLMLFIWKPLQATRYSDCLERYGYM